MSTPAFAQQQTIVDDFVQGNSAYAKEKYPEAISFYQKVLDAGEASGPLFYNLGNAYFKEGDIGKTILNYERAFEYIPRDGDLRANYFYALSLTEKTAAKEPANMVQRFFERHFSLYTVNEVVWLIFFLVLAAAVCHLLSLYFAWPLSRKVGLLIVFILLLGFYATGLWTKMKMLDHRAVVLKDAPALFEPRKGATVYFSLFGGNFVDTIRKDGQWTKIRRFDGKEGWVRSGMIAKINPAPGKEER